MTARRDPAQAGAGRIVTGGAAPTATGAAGLAGMAMARPGVGPVGRASATGMAARPVMAGNGAVALAARTARARRMTTVARAARRVVALGAARVAVVPADRAAADRVVTGVAAVVRRVTGARAKGGALKMGAGPKGWGGTSPGPILYFQVSGVCGAVAGMPRLSRRWRPSATGA